MTPKEIADLYYNGWISKHSDLSEVPIAPNFRFRGPVASFDSAEGYRAMAREAGAMVTKFTVRHQFVEGNRVCSIIDWEMALPVAPMTSAELLEVENGRLVRGELIYDAQELRAAESAEWKTPPPLRTGAQVGFTAHFLGRRLTYTYEIAEFIPGERLVMRTAQGPFPMETTYTWAPAGSGATHMTLRNRGEPAGFSRILAPFIAGAMRRANSKDLARLKSILEAT